MPRPEFSEREYENVVTRELSTAWRAVLVRPFPEMPSTKAEERVGTDATYEFTHGKRLALQFKAASFASRKSGSNVALWDAWSGQHPPGYYRFDLLPGRHGDCTQHRRLVELAGNGEDVFYVAPRFYKEADLLQHAQLDEAWLHSLHARLTPQTPTFSDQSHCVTYPQNGLSWRLHSPGQGEAFDAEEPSEVFETAQDRDLAPAAFAEFVATLQGLLVQEDVGVNLPRSISAAVPAVQAAWLLGVYFGAVLIVADHSLTT